MGKNKKDHRRKVELRNQKIALVKKSDSDMKRKFLMDLIEKERLSGKFNNTNIDENSGDMAELIVDGPQL